MRLAFERLIPDQDELEQFALWAFGPSYRDLEMGTQFMDLWNQYHGDDLTLVPSGAISEDSIKMVDLWKDSLVRLSKYGLA